MFLFFCLLLFSITSNYCSYEDYRDFDLVKSSFDQTQTLLKFHSQSTLVNHFLNKYRSDITTFIPQVSPIIPKILSILKGHDKSVTSSALSNDNTKVLTGSADCTARLWDISNPSAPQLLATLKGHIGDVLSVALSKDNTKALTGSKDSTAILWNISNPSAPQLLATLKGHNDYVHSVVLSNDNTKALTGGREGSSQPGTAKLWDISNPAAPQLLATLKGHNSYVYSVALNNNNTKVLTSSDDNTAILWDISNPSSPQLLATLKGASSVSSVAISGDNTKALIGGREGYYSYSQHSYSQPGTAKLWDISNPSSPQLLATLKGHINDVTSVAISNDGAKALTGSAHDNTVILWDISNHLAPRILATLKERHNRSVTSVVLSNDNTKALTSSDDNTPILWDISNPSLNLLQIQLLAKLANLKEYNQELDQSDWSKIFDSLKNDTKNNVLQLIKKLPDGKVKKQKNEQEKSEEGKKAQDEKKSLQDLKNLKDLQEKQDKILTDAENERKRFEQEKLKFEKEKHDFEKARKKIEQDKKDLELRRIKSEQDVKDEAKRKLDEAEAKRLKAEKDAEDLRKRLEEYRKQPTLDYDKIAEKLLSKLPLSPNSKAEKDAADSRKKLEDLEKQFAQFKLYSLSPKSPDSKSNLELLESDSGFNVVQDLENKLSKDEKDSLKKSIKDKYYNFFKKLSGNNSSTLKGHSGTINAVIMSNDSKLVLTGGSDNVTRVWNLQDHNNPSESAVLKAHSLAITGIGLSNDNETAYTSSLDKSVYIWDLQDPTEPTRIKASSAINSLALCSGLLLTGQADNNAVLWNISRIPAKIKATLSGHTSPVNSAAFSHNGKLAVTGSDDKTTRIWDLDKTQTSLHTLTGHTNSVKSVAISHDDKLVLTGSADNSAILWSIAKMASVIKASHLKGHTDSVNATAFCTDSKLAFTGSSDSTVKIWNIEDPRNAINIRTIIDHNNSVLAIAINDRYLLTGCSDSLARLFNLNTVNLENLNLVQLALFIKLANLTGINRTAGLGHEDIKNYKDIINTLDLGVRNRVLELYPEFAV